MKSEVGIEIGSQPQAGRWPGARHGEWTLRQMLRAPVRDLLAARGREAGGLVLGCGTGRTARWLLGLGLAQVLGAEARDDRLAEAERGRREHAIDGAQLRFLDFAELSDSDRADLVLLESVAGTGIGEAEALARARALTTGLCAIATDARLISRDLARAAGFDRVSLIEPPTDAERSFVLRERCLLLARPAEVAADG